MEPDGVDFVVSSAGTLVDEDLPEPPHREWSRRTRLAVGIAALAAVTGTVVAATRGSTPAPRPTAAPTTVRSSDVITFVPRPPSAVVVLDPLTGGPTCPQAGDGQSSCESSRWIPGAVRAALARHFAGARVVAEVNQSLRDVGFGPGGLWYRRITATAGALRITVVVRKPLPEDVTMGDSRIVGNREVMSTTTGSGGFTVSVVVSAPVDHPNISGSVDLLVSDQRLLARS